MGFGTLAVQRGNLNGLTYMTVKSSDIKYDAYWIKPLQTADRIYTRLDKTDTFNLSDCWYD